MFDCMEYMADHEHEQLVFNYDRHTGLRALIAIHNTTLGPSLGGTRLWRYERREDAVLDVLRLSEGMTYKAAVAGLPLGGGKAVILADGQEADPQVRAARFQAFGRFVDSLSGRYITAEDVGTKPGDMMDILSSTRHVVGLPLERGGSGDPSPMTAFGVLRGIQALVEEVLHTDSLKGVRVAVQGMLGKVGMALTEYLLEAGAVVVGTDIHPGPLREAGRKLGVEVVEDPEAIYSVPCDIFAPCALGAILNDHSIPQLRCKIIAGAANNQLQDIERHAAALQELGIVYAVDYVINAGGLINVASELGGYDPVAAREKTSRIYYTIKRMLLLAQEEGISTQQAATLMARRALKSEPVTA